MITPELVEKAKANGIGYQTLWTRLRKGWSEAQAVGIPVHELKAYRDRAEKNGIENGTFYSRIYQGWDYEKAATEPVKERDTYPEDAVVSESSYYRRRRKGMSREEAAYKPATRRVQKPKYITDEQRKIAEKNGITLNAINNRIRRDMDVETAITKPMRKRGAK